MERFNITAFCFFIMNSLERLEESKLVPKELFVGEKALIYLHPNNFDVFNTFW